MKWFAVECHIPIGRRKGCYDFFAATAAATVRGRPVFQGYIEHARLYMSRNVFHEPMLQMRMAYHSVSQFSNMLPSVV